jgi:hypothetical protein
MIGDSRNAKRQKVAVFNVFDSLDPLKCGFRLRSLAHMRAGLLDVNYMPIGDNYICRSAPDLLVDVGSPLLGVFSAAARCVDREERTTRKAISEPRGWVRTR